MEIRFFRDVTTKKMMHYKNIKKAIEFKLLKREVSIDRCERLCFQHSPRQDYEAGVYRLWFWDIGMGNFLISCGEMIELVWKYCIIYCYY